VVFPPDRRSFRGPPTSEVPPYRGEPPGSGSFVDQYAQVVGQGLGSQHPVQVVDPSKFLDFLSNESAEFEKQTGRPSPMREAAEAAKLQMGPPPMTARPQHLPYLRLDPPAGAPTPSGVAPRPPIPEWWDTEGNFVKSVDPVSGTVMTPGYQQELAKNRPFATPEQVKRFGELMPSSGVPQPPWANLLGQIARSDIGSRAISDELRPSSININAAMPFLGKGVKSVMMARHGAKGIWPAIRNLAGNFAAPVLEGKAPYPAQVLAESAVSGVAGAAAMGVDKVLPENTNPWVRTGTTLLGSLAGGGVGSMAITRAVPRKWVNLPGGTVGALIDENLDSFMKFDANRQDIKDLITGSLARGGGRSDKYTFVTSTDPDDAVRIIRDGYTIGTRPQFDAPTASAAGQIVHVFRQSDLAGPDLPYGGPPPVGRKAKPIASFISGYDILEHLSSDIIFPKRADSAPGEWSMADEEAEEAFKEKAADILRAIYIANGVTPIGDGPPRGAPREGYSPEFRKKVLELQTTLRAAIQKTRDSWEQASRGIEWDEQNWPTNAPWTMSRDEFGRRYAKAVEQFEAQTGLHHFPAEFGGDLLQREFLITLMHRHFIDQALSRFYSTARSRTYGVPLHVLADYPDLWFKSGRGDLALIAARATVPSADRPVTHMQWYWIKDENTFYSKKVFFKAVAAVDAASKGRGVRRITFRRNDEFLGEAIDVYWIHEDSARAVMQRHGLTGSIDDLLAKEARGSYWGTSNELTLRPGPEQAAAEDLRGPLPDRGDWATFQTDEPRPVLERGDILFREQEQAATMQQPVGGQAQPLIIGPTTSMDRIRELEKQAAGRAGEPDPVAGTMDEAGGIGSAPVSDTGRRARIQYFLQRYNPYGPVHPQYPYFNWPKISSVPGEEIIPPPKSFEELKDIVRKLWREATEREVYFVSKVVFARATWWARRNKKTIADYFNENYVGFSADPASSSIDLVRPIDRIEGLSFPTNQAELDLVLKKISNSEDQDLLIRIYKSVFALDPPTGRAPYTDLERRELSDRVTKLLFKQVTTYRRGLGPLVKALGGRIVRRDRRPGFYVNASGKVVHDPQELGPPATVLAYQQRMDDGRSLMVVLMGTDWETALHEFAHAFRNDLANSPGERHLYDALTAWATNGTGQWDNVAEEKFARGFVQWLREGDAPSPELKNAFLYFRDWLRQTWNAILEGTPGAWPLYSGRGAGLVSDAGSKFGPEGHPISKEVRNAFSEMFGGPNWHSQDPGASAGWEAAPKSAQVTEAEQLFNAAANYVDQLRAMNLTPHREPQKTPVYMEEHELFGERGSVGEGQWDHTSFLQLRSMVQENLKNGNHPLAGIPMPQAWRGGWNEPFYWQRTPHGQGGNTFAQMGPVDPDPDFQPWPSPLRDFVERRLARTGLRDPALDIAFEDGTPILSQEVLDQAVRSNKEQREIFLGHAGSVLGPSGTPSGPSGISIALGHSPLTAPLGVEGEVSALAAPTPPGGTLLDKAQELARTQQSLSASLLQRHFKIGYPAAARLMDELEVAGVVGAGEPGKPRQVLTRGGTPSGEADNYWDRLYGASRGDVYGAGEAGGYWDRLYGEGSTYLSRVPGRPTAPPAAAASRPSAGAEIFRHGINWDSLYGGRGSGSGGPPRPPVAQKSNPLDAAFTILPSESVSTAIVRAWEGARNLVSLHVENWYKQGHNRLRKQGFDPDNLNEATMRPLFEALHGERHPSELSPQLQEIYKDIIARRDRVEAETREFLEAVTGKKGSINRSALSALGLTEPKDILNRMDRLDEYFPRFWRLTGPLEGAAQTGAGSKLTRKNASLSKRRVSYTFVKMLETGHEPLSWDPYAMMGMREISGAELKEALTLIARLMPDAEGNSKYTRAFQVRNGTVNVPLLLDKDSYLMWASDYPDLKGRYRVPKIGSFFEAAGRYVPNDLADKLELIFGMRPSWRIEKLGNLDVAKTLSDWSAVVKEAKLAGSLFQDVDFTMRATATSFAPSTILSGKTHNIVPFIYRLFGTRLSGNMREALARKIAGGVPIYKDSDITLAHVVKNGWSIHGDLTLLRRTGMEFLNTLMAQPGLTGAARRQLMKTRRFMSEGLFEGTYRLAQVHALENFIIPYIRRQHPDWTTDQIAALAAREVNTMFSTPGRWQTVFSDPNLAEVTRLAIFSVAENESMLKQAIGAVYGPSKGLWANYWIGMFIALAVVANAINLAAEGKPLPADSYSPISIGDPNHRKFFGKHIGYNTRFMSPRLPFLKGRNGGPVYLDLVGQMDTVFRWTLDWSGAINARWNVIPRAITNQVQGETFTGVPLDTPAKRVAQGLIDVAAPIGATSGLGALASAFPKQLGNIIPDTEARLGVAGQLAQTTGFNLRSESTPQMLDRLAKQYGEERWDQLSADAKKRALQVSGLQGELDLRQAEGLERDRPGAEYSARLSKADSNRIEDEESLLHENAVALFDGSKRADAVLRDIQNGYYRIQDRSKGYRAATHDILGKEKGESQKPQVPDSLRGVDRRDALRELAQWEYDKAFSDAILASGGFDKKKFDLAYKGLWNNWSEDQKQWVLGNQSQREHPEVMLEILKRKSGQVAGIRDLLKPYQDKQYRGPRKPQIFEAPVPVGAR